MEKRVVRTEAAPAPFQGAPYNQAIVAGDFVFVAGQLGLKPGDAAVEGDIAQQTEQALANVAGDPRGRGQLAGQPRQDERLPRRPRRLPGDERGVRDPRRRPAAGALDVRGREAAVGRARRDRGHRAPVEQRVPRATARIRLVPTAIRRYVRSLGLDAYVVGGAVRDELLGIAARRRGLPRPGRRPGRAAVGARAARPGRGHGGARPARRRAASTRATGRSAALVPAGIELTPPRAERSTGPGHRDFEIVADRTISIEEDMARRDFTVNAIAQAPRDGRARRPVRRRRATSIAASCEPSPRRASARTRSASCAGSGSSRSSASRSRRRPSRRCAPRPAGCATSRPSGSAAASRRTGWASCRSCCSGPRPRDALRLARDTGALVEVVPEFEAAIGYDLDSARQPLPLDEHVFAVVQNAADARRLARRAAGGAAPRPRRSPRRTRTTATTRSSAPGSPAAHHAPPALPERSAAGGRAARRRARVLARRPDRRRVRAALPRLARPRPCPRAPRSTSAPTWPPRRSSRGSSSISRCSSGTSRSSATRRTGSATSSVDGRDLIELGLPGRAGARRASSPVSSTSWSTTRANEREHAARAGARGARVNAADVRERYLRVRDEAGADVTVVAATKYVSLDELGRPRRGGGRGGGGEPRPGPRGEACGVRRRVPLALHRPPPVEQGQGRERDLRARALARLRLGRPAAHRSRAARGEPHRRGHRRRASRPTSSPGWLERYPSIRGPDDDAAARRRPRGVASVVSAPARARREHGLEELSMGTSQDWRVAVEEGATLIRVGSSLFR